MTIQHFCVHIVLAGKESDYRDLMNGKTETEDGRKLRSHEVMNTGPIEARSLTEARKKAAIKYPGQTVHVKSTK